LTTINLLDFDLSFVLYIDGERISSYYLRAGEQKPAEFRGVQNSATTVLAFKFQELELVGTFYEHPLMFLIMFVYYLLPKTQTWNTPLSGQKWGPLKFELFAASTGALVHVNYITMQNCIKDVYRSAARRQGGIMSGTTPPKPHVQFPFICDDYVIRSALQARYPINFDLQ
jgi:hypothetical protein